MNELNARANELVDAFEDYEPDDENRGEPAPKPLRWLPIGERALLER